MKDDDSYPVIVPIIFAIITSVLCIWLIVELNKLDLLNILSLIALLSPIAIGVLILIAWIWSLPADGLSFEGALLWVAKIIIFLIYIGSRQ